MSGIDTELVELFSSNVLDKPEVFLVKTEESATQAKAVTKFLYDLGKTNESKDLKEQTSMLEELFVDGFDNEQIWEEIQMQNVPFLAYLKTQLKALKSKKKSATEEEGDEDAEMAGLEEDDLEMEDMDQDVQDSEEDDEEEPVSGEDGLEGGFASDEEDLEGLGASDEDEADDLEGEEEDDEEEDDLDEDLQEDAPIKKRAKRSEVDDDFFNLEEFNAWTEKQEQEDEDDEPNPDEEEIDWGADPDLIDSGDDEDIFGSDNEDENEVDAHDVGYDQFFAPPETGKTYRPKAKPKAKPEATEEDEETIFGKEEDEEASADGNQDKVTDLFADDNGDDEDVGTLSKFEQQQRKLKQQIDMLEKENVAGKDWTKKGEASSSDRPLNSLLEEDLDFETATKPIPVITAESTKTLEDIIKERILEANWDDVVRKTAPNPKGFNPSSRVEISDEKSKKSLSELYEDDYVRDTSTAGPQLSERELALEKKHDEITELWQDLCQKLDSLSNWYYTPKAAKAELTVVSNAPAISMEEAIPVSVADAALLAPEEIYSATKTPMKGDTEMEQAERKRKRAHAKRSKKAENKERATKEAERQKERELKDKRLGRQVGDKGNAKTIVRDKLDAVKALSGQKNISFIDRDGNKRASIKGAAKEAAKSAKLKL